MEDESAPLHPTQKEKRIVMDQIAMANSLSPHCGHGLLFLNGRGVEGESAPFHSTEKEQSMVKGHRAMTNSPSLEWARGGG